MYANIQLGNHLKTETKSRNVVYIKYSCLHITNTITQSQRITDKIRYSNVLCYLYY